MALTLTDMAASMRGKLVGERYLPHSTEWYRPACWRCRIGRLLRRPHMVLTPIYEGGALQRGILADLLAASKALEHLPVGQSGFDAMLLAQAGDLPSTYLRSNPLPEAPHAGY